MSERHRRVADLTLGFLTVGANAAPLATLEAAAAAGFGAAGLRVSGRFPADPWPSVDGDPSAFATIRDAAAAASVRISSISGFYISPQTNASHLLANVQAAAAVGARVIAQGCFEPDAERLADLLRDYAAAAGDAGLRIALEFMPMSALKTIAQSLELIEASGADNVGLLVDTLHLARSGAGAAEVAALGAERIVLTQLSDAPAELPKGVSLFDEAMRGRQSLGDGGLDLAAVVRALRPDAELELETPVAAHAALPPTQRARLAADAARRFFDAHFAVPDSHGRGTDSRADTGSKLS